MTKSKSTRVRGRKFSKLRSSTSGAVKHAATRAAQFAYETAFDLIFKAAVAHEPNGTVNEVLNVFLAAMRDQLEWRERSFKYAQTQAAVRS